MRVLLVQAAAYFPEIERSMPLGLLYLASYLRDHKGCVTDVFDMQLRVRTTAPVIDRAKAFQPDLIGISGMTPDAKVIGSLARAFKDAFPTVPVVVGGSHASNSPEAVMQEPAVDYAIPHEGETPFGALVDALREQRDVEGVPSVIHRRNGSLRRNPPAPFIEDLDKLPYPAFDLIDMEPYYRIQRCGVIFARRRYAPMVSSRGCPYRCAYCHNILGKTNRRRSPENVVGEMKWLHDRFGVGEFIIMDDMFNLVPERVNQIARLIIASGMDIRLSFPIGLRADIMTEESIRLLKQAGMYRCMYAVETASARLQKLIHKNNDLGKVLHVIDYTRSQGIMVHGSFMLGFPTEREEEARATIDLACRSRLHTAAFYRVIPFWGTELYRMARERGADIEHDMEKYEFHKSHAINVSDMSDETLERIKREAYRRFYLSPRRLGSIFLIMPNRWRLMPLLFLTWVRKALLW